MILITLSTDLNILKKESAVRERMISYGSLFECLHIVLISKGHTKVEMLSDTVSVTTTGGFTRFNSLLRAGIILCQTINRFKKDNQKIVLSSQDPFEQGFVCYFVAKLCKVKLHLQVHTDVFSPYFASESFLQKVRVKIARFLLPRADGVRVVSERIANSFKKERIILKCLPAVLPIFIDTEEIRSYISKIDLHKKYPQFDQIILMLSRFEKEKNIQLGIDAFSGILEKFPRAGLVLVGQGKEKGILKQKVQDLQIEKKVIFEGWTDDPISYFKTADIFLNTSNYEGYGMVFVQAYASGIPIVSTDVGIAKEIGAHVVSRDSCEVADTLSLVLDMKFSANKAEKSVSQSEYLAKYKKSFDWLV